MESRPAGDRSRSSGGQPAQGTSRRCRYPGERSGEPPSTEKDRCMAGIRRPNSTITPGTGAALAVAVFLTRLPFVSHGYGTDTDTWKFASAIREIADSGRYTTSRMPGYPLMEWLCTPFAHWGPWAPNTLSAVAAAACAWLTARLCARHGMRHAWLAGAAFAFVPPAY